MTFTMYLESFFMLNCTACLVCCKHYNTNIMKNNLLDITTIYYEPAILNYSRGLEILNHYSNVERIEVASHWNIPELHRNEDLIEDWNKVKRNVLVLGVKKSVKCTPFYRSCDFIAPSHANGCAMACVYCVASGTFITTPGGQVPVEHVHNGDEICAYDALSKQVVVATVSGTTSREVDVISEIRVGDNVLQATIEHPIMTRTGWVQVGELRTGEEILCYNTQSELEYRKIIDISPITTPTSVYNFHVIGPESYIANGIVTHNCYVARRKGFANPITTFVNIEQICASIEKHAAKQGMKLEPSQADPSLWVYEVGTNNDCSVDALISNNVRDLVALFRCLPNAKMTFATKYVNREMLTYDPEHKTRVRFSLMPQDIAKVVDVRTSPVAERIAAMNDFFDAGYEANINFGPVIYHDGWLEAYRQLFEQLDDVLTPQVKAQLQAEVIFLTHNEQLHDVNMQWHPKAEELLWRPDVQEAKVSQAGGGDNLRYKLSIKRGLVDAFCTLLSEKLPYCKIRYAF